MIKQTSKTFNRPALFSAITAAIALSAGNHLHADGLMLEEIVVTAQKRSENLQDVAASIAAIGSDALDDNAITNFKDITKLVPGLVMKQSGANDTSISLRGINYDRKSAQSSAVDVYWNGAAYRANAMFTSMFDVERLEVLRGPQGTLQGRTSPAGAIILHTTKPSFDGAQGQVKSSISDSGERIGEFGIELPVNDELAVRLAGIYNDNDGQNNNNFFSGEKDKGEVRGARISVAYEPIDEFDALAVYERVTSNTSDTSQVVGTGSYGSISLDDKVGLKNRQHEVDMETEISVLTLNYRGIDNHEITSISSYNSLTLSELDDFDPTGKRYNSTFVFDVENDAKNFSQELRIASTEAQWWEYTAGIYYSNLNIHANNAIDDALYTIDTDITKEDFGYFTHNRIDLSDVSELQVGLRYNRSRRDSTNTLAVPSISYAADLNSDHNYVGDGFTGLVKYIHYVTEDVMAYASVDVSYRPGGSNINPVIVLPSQIDALTFNEEDTLALELGFKSTLLGGRMQLNGAFYYQQLDEYQDYVKEIQVAASASNPTASTAESLVANADAISMGAELEATGLITENWRAGVLLAYNDFTFADGETGYCNIEGAALNAHGTWVSTCDISGQRVGENPNWNASVNSDYTLPLDDVDLFLRGSYTFTGASFAPSLPSSQNKAGAHGVFDLFAGVRSKDQNWEVSLWAKNLLDKVAETEKLTTESNGYREVKTIAERSVGANLRYNFSL